MKNLVIGLLCLMMAACGHQSVKETKLHNSGSQTIVVNTPHVQAYRNFLVGFQDCQPGGTHLEHHIYEDVGEAQIAVRGDFGIMFLVEMTKVSETETKVDAYAHNFARKRYFKYVEGKVNGAPVDC